MPHDYTAQVHWQREAGEAFVDNRYHRRHRLCFDGGVEVPGSSAPHVVPLPLSDAAAVDPEEAFVASLASCHMLWFLSIAAKRGFRVDRYADAASGTMAKNADGRWAMTQVTLRPTVVCSGERRPTRAELDAMHHAAHEECFIANSVKTEVRCEPAPESWRDVLAPLDAAAYADWAASCIAGYARENVAAGRWSTDGAPERSRRELEALLPQGLATPDQHLFAILDPRTGGRVGVLWLGVVERGGERVGHIYDIEVDAAQRRRGHAGRALRAIEAFARDLGLASIGLHVFEHNPGARALYEQLGYAATGVNMVRHLERTGPRPDS